MNIRQYILEARPRGFRGGPQRGFEDPSSKEYRPEEDWEFGALKNKKVIRALRTTSNIVNAINAIISIGSTISYVLKSSSEWYSDIKSYLSRRKRSKDFNNIVLKATALAKTVVEKDSAQQQKVLQNIRTDPLNSFQAIRRLYASEIALAFNDLEMTEETEPAIKAILPLNYHNKDIQNIINNRNYRRELVGIRDKALETVSHYQKDIVLH